MAAPTLLPTDDALSALERDSLHLLAEFLASPRAPKGALPLLALDGYLTAVAVARDLIMPHEWLPGVWGGENPLFADRDEAQAILSALTARYNAILSQLSRRAPRPLYLPADPAARAPTARVAEWANGFWKGMMLPGAGFEALVRDRAARNLLAPIVCFAEDKDGRRLLRAARGDDDPLLQRAHDLIPDCLLAIRDYWQPHHAGPRARAAPGRARRPGRNEPCPCGSGRKFKRCCGAD